MAATRQNVVIEQGVTTDVQLEWLAPTQLPAAPPPPPIDATWAALLEIRAHPRDPDPPLLEASTENGRLVYDAQRNEFNLHLEAGDTVGLTWTTGVYDLIVWDPAVAPIAAYRVLEGTAWLAPVVSRPTAP